MGPTVRTVTDIVSTTLEQFTDSIVGSLPATLSGILFFGLAYVFIRILRAIVRAGLDRIYPGDQRLIADFALIVLTAFMWFGAGLVFLRVLGMGDIGLRKSRFELDNGETVVVANGEVESRWTLLESDRP